MGKAAKQAKNKAKHIAQKNIMHSVKGSLENELPKGLGEQIFNELNKSDGE